MKNEKQRSLLLLFLFSLSFSSLLFGQKNEEFIFSKIAFSSYNTTVTLGDRVYSVGSGQECKFPNLRQNTSLQAKGWSGQGSMVYTDLMLMPGLDSLLLTCGYFSELGDVGPLEEGPRVLAYDLDGTVVFDNLLALEPDAVADTDMQLTINGDGQIVVEMGSQLYWLAANGDFQKVQSYADATFVDIDQLDASTMLALAEDKLYWLNNAGDEMSSLEIMDTAIDLWIGHGLIYVLTETSIELISINNPNDVQSYDLSVQGIEGVGLNGNEDYLLVWGVDLLQGNSKIIQFEKISLTLVESVLFDELMTEVLGLEVVGDELILSGRTSTGFDNLHFAFIKRTELLKAPTFYSEGLSFDNFEVLNKLDLSIDELNVGPDSVIYFYYYTAFPLVYELGITNEGADTLRSFSFYSNNHSIFDCIGGRIYKHYDNLAIPPGESFSILDSANLVFPGTTLPEVPPLNLGIFAPNEHFEQDLSDNQVQHNFPVGLDAPLAKAALSLELAPNPAQDFVQLTFQGEEKIREAQLVLIDLQGKKLLSQTTDLEKGKKIILEIPHVPSGLYFLNILSPDQLTSRKLIIQR